MKHRKPRANVSISTETREKLIRYAQKNKLTMKVIAEHAIDMMVKYDLAKYAVVGPDGNLRICLYCARASTPKPPKSLNNFDLFID